MGTCKIIGWCGNLKCSVDGCQAEKLIDKDKSRLVEMYLNNIKVLVDLVELRKFKELNGKTSYYKDSREKVWKEAESLLKKLGYDIKKVDVDVKVLKSRSLIDLYSQLRKWEAKGWYRVGDVREERLLETYYLAINKVKS